MLHAVLCWTQNECTGPVTRASHRVCSPCHMHGQSSCAHPVLNQPDPGVTERALDSGVSRGCALSVMHGLDSALHVVQGIREAGCMQCPGSMPTCCLQHWVQFAWCRQHMTFPGPGAGPCRTQFDGYSAAVPSWFGPQTGSGMLIWPAGMDE